MRTTIKAAGKPMVPVDFGSVDTTLTLQETDCIGSMECGFRQEWASGENEHIEFSLDSGAGLGSPYMQLSITDQKTKEKRYYRVDMRDWLKANLNELATRPKGANHAV